MESLSSCYPLPAAPQIKESQPVPKHPAQRVVRTYHSRKLQACLIGGTNPCKRVIPIRWSPTMLNDRFYFPQYQTSHALRLLRKKTISITSWRTVHLGKSICGAFSSDAILPWMRGYTHS